VIRIPAHAIPIYLDECDATAYHAYVEDGADPAAEDRDKLTAAHRTRDG
jgi:hypothetical protein